MINSTKRSQNLGNEAHPSKFDSDELKIRTQHMNNFINEQKGLAAQDDDDTKLGATKQSEDKVEEEK